MYRRNRLPSRFGGWVALFGVTTVALSGCHDDRTLPTCPVSGKVALDGKPLAGAEIWLVPTDANETVKNAKMTIRPYAKSKADGTFTLTSYFVDDGAPVGEYAVMVVLEGAQANTEEERENDAPAEKGGRPRRGSRLPAKYTSPTTSGLTFTVKDGPNQLDLDLKSK